VDQCPWDAAAPSLPRKSGSPNVSSIKFFLPVKHVVESVASLIFGTFVLSLPASILWTLSDKGLPSGPVSHVRRVWAKLMYFGFFFLDTSPPPSSFCPPSTSGAFYFTAVQSRHPHSSSCVSNVEKRPLSLLRRTAPIFFFYSFSPQRGPGTRFCRLFTTIREFDCKPGLLSLTPPLPPKRSERQTVARLGFPLLPPGPFLTETP